MPHPVRCLFRFGKNCEVFDLLLRFSKSGTEVDYFCKQNALNMNSHVRWVCSYLHCLTAVNILLYTLLLYGGNLVLR
jgi:hypothetical protein